MPAERMVPGIYDLAQKVRTCFFYLSELVFIRGQKIFATLRLCGFLYLPASRQSAKFFTCAILQPE